jgi:hypothetical protein
MHALQPPSTFLQRFFAEDVQELPSLHGAKTKNMHAFAGRPGKVRCQRETRGMHAEAAGVVVDWSSGGGAEARQPHVRRDRSRSWLVAARARSPVDRHVRPRADRYELDRKPLGPRGG